MMRILHWEQNNVVLLLPWWCPLFTLSICLPPPRKTETNERQQLQLPSDSDVRNSTIDVNDLFEEEDRCLGQYTTHQFYTSKIWFFANSLAEILHQIDNLVFHHATLVQLLTPLAPVWHQLGEELGLTTHVKKIEVNNMEKEENCLRALLYVWEEQSQKRFYSWTTIVKCVKNLGAVRLANACTGSKNWQPFCTDCVARIFIKQKLIAAAKLWIILSVNMAMCSVVLLWARDLSLFTYCSLYHWRLKCCCSLLVYCCLLEVSDIM